MSTPNSIFKETPLFPYYCPTLKEGEMGKFEIIPSKATDGVMRTTFKKPHLDGGFAEDQFSKLKCTMILAPTEVLELINMKRQLEEHVTKMFPEKKFKVKEPHFNAQIRVGWPVEPNTNPRKYKRVKCVCEGKVTRDCDKDWEDVNDCIELFPVNEVQVDTRLWLRCEKDPNGELVYVVGMYFQLLKMVFQDTLEPK